MAIGSLEPHDRFEGVMKDSEGRLWKLGEKGELKRTYPSWEERGPLEEVKPNRKMARRKEDEILAKQVAGILIRKGLPPNGGVHRKEVTNAIEEIRGTDRGNWNKLKDLWYQGLARRMGRKSPNSRRYRDQLWFL